MGEGIRLQIQGAHGTNSGPEQPDGMRHCPKQQCTRIWSTWFNAVTISCNL